MRIRIFIISTLCILLSHMACREINVVDPQEETNEKSKGIYFNRSFLRPAGIDTLFINEGDTVSVEVSTILINKPEYIWSNDDNSVINLETNPGSDSLVYAIALADSGGLAAITLEDTGNETIKNLPVKIVKYWADPLLFAYIGGLNGHHYYLSRYKKTWIEAKDECESAGGHLVTITSEEENALVADTQLRGGLNTWIGLTFLLGNDRLTNWITGEDATAYQNYQSKPGSPGIFAEYFFHFNTDGKWENWHEVSYLYILEME